LQQVLKYPITILLITIVAVQTFSKCFVIAGYEINKDYIAKNLCINRMKPCSCCKGKCFLGKKLSKDEDQQAPVKNGQKQEQQLQWDTQNNLQTALMLPVIIKSVFSPYIHNNLSTFNTSFFHPPQI
jgi:hypothetical protein